MKKLVLFSLFIIVFASCSKTLEQKATTLIEEDLKKSLYKPESYQPVETKVDSAFSPYADPQFIKQAIEIFDIAVEMQQFQQTMENAKSTMDIFSPSDYQTEFSKNEYNESKEEYDNANFKLERAKKRLDKRVATLKKLFDEKPKFVGYEVYHTYRANNNRGNTIIAHAYYILDKDMKNILISLDESDFNYTKLQAIIKQIKDELEEVE